MKINLNQEKCQILKLCENLNFYKDVKRILDSEAICLKAIVNEKENDYKVIRDYLDQKQDSKFVGIYLFLNKEGKPVYVGLSGVLEKKSKSDLFKRVQSQLVNSSTLVKNIHYIENLLGNKVKKCKSIILDYAPYLIIHKCLKPNSENDIEKAQKLESFFLSTLHLKYNR